MKPIKARIISTPDGKVLNAVVEIPCVTGDEGFGFLSAFQRKCGITPETDLGAQQRIRAVIERQEREAKERK